jgi:uncharacterized membrane protein YkvA (DUF1232 family)
MKSVRTFLHDLRIAAHAVWIGARDTAVALPVRLFGLAVAAYAMSPIDLIPDFIPVLGLIDDLILVPIGIWMFIRMIPADVHARHVAEAERAEQKPISKIGAAIIVLIWIGIAIWVAGLVLAGKYY